MLSPLRHPCSLNLETPGSRPCASVLTTHTVISQRYNLRSPHSYVSRIQAFYLLLKLQKLVKLYVRSNSNQWLPRRQDHFLTLLTEIPEYLQYLDNKYAKNYSVRLREIRKLWHLDRLSQLKSLARFSWIEWTWRALARSIARSSSDDRASRCLSSTGKQV